ncbi:serine hydrolase domain-containing protein [Flammeovirga aprica]|uniref:Serine hydrolase n=1 Tax=Flammeovirga aprica JL-4 TaxID=694437 RepID=A0A7X9P2Z3_9BACT|nr:serine hydrolase [Flammeovirga aprica]NME68589.1 serine hydrolase [Flammeovirga aprica JL-4]
MITPIKNNTPISFISLSNHTSGLPGIPSNLKLTKVDPDNPYKNYHEKELVDYLTDSLELSNKGKYAYSNLAVGLLGYTLSEIDNTTYESLLHEKIFSKYNMKKSTSVFGNVKDDLVVGLNTAGKETPNWEFTVLAGAGGILSNVEDLSNFAIAQFDSSNKVLELTRKKTFEINDDLEIGLGWHILKSQSDHPWHSHMGGTGGYTSSIIIDEITKNGIIVLSNVSAYNPNVVNVEKMGFELMKSLLPSE